MIYYHYSVFVRAKRKLINRIFSLLPLSYALTGTLFLCFQLRKLYPDYSIEHIKLIIQLPYLVLWGLLSILFWSPALAKEQTLSLIDIALFFSSCRPVHVFVQLTSSSADDNIIKNDMKVYASSLVLSLGAITFLILLSFPFDYYKKHLTFPEKMANQL